MARLPHLTIATPQNRSVRTHFPRTQRALLAPGHDLRMAAFSTALGCEQVVPRPLLEEMRPLCNAAADGAFTDKARTGCRCAGCEIYSRDVDGKVLEGLSAGPRRRADGFAVGGREVDGAVVVPEELPCTI